MYIVLIANNIFLYDKFYLKYYYFLYTLMKKNINLDVY
jgi:hypothetical protein